MLKRLSTYDMLSNVDIYIDFYYGLRISVEYKYHDCKIINKYLHFHVLVKILKCTMLVFTKVQITDTWFRRLNWIKCSRARSRVRLLVSKPTFRGPSLFSSSGKLDTSKIVRFMISLSVTAGGVTRGVGGPQAITDRHIMTRTILEISSFPDDEKRDGPRNVALYTSNLTRLLIWEYFIQISDVANADPSGRAV
jgi:hypothetical protein